MGLDLNQAVRPDRELLTVGFSKSLGHGALCLALSDGLLEKSTESCAEMLVGLLSRDPAIQTEYAKPANGFVGYNTAVHTAMAINQRQRYGLGKDLPIARGPNSPHISTRGIDAALLLHDLAKYVPGEAKSTHAEHQRTLAFVRPYLAHLPFNDRQRDVIVDLIDNDVLGEFFMRAFPTRPPKEEKWILQEAVRSGQFDATTYHGIIDRWTNAAAIYAVDKETRENLIARCVEQFECRAKKLDMKPLELLDMQVVFFQADTSSYSYDASAFGVRSGPALDYLYARNAERSVEPFLKLHPEQARLLFSPAYEELFLELRSQVS